MKVTVRLLFLIQLGVLVLGPAVSAWAWGLSTGLAVLAGAGAFAFPAAAFSLLVLRASEGDQTRFFRRFLLAEALKWVAAAGLLAWGFVSGALAPTPLIAGFLLSVLVQLTLPIFVPRKERET